MSNLSVCIRYAGALIRLAEEKKKIDKVYDDMILIKNSLKGSRELRSALANPVIKTEKKNSILEAVFNKKICAETMNFLKFTVNKNRADVLSGIAEEYIKLKDKKEGFIAAKVVSAFELAETQKKTLQKKVESFAGMKAKVEYAVDEKLIGGFLFAIDDTVVDASLKRRIEMLKESFSGEAALN